MALISYTDKDILRGQVITPAWYRVRIDSVGETPTTGPKGPSTNYPVEATILFEGDNGDIKYHGFPLEWNFNSKAIGFSVGFLAALGVEVKAGVRFDLAQSAGREIDVYVENGEWQGRIVNRVNHKYRPIRSEVTARTA